MGWALLGSYYSALGDAGESERCFVASLRLCKDSVTHANYHTNLGNLGYFSKAHAHFVEHGRPEAGFLSMMSSFAQTMGSFQTAVAYTKKAEAMGIEPQVSISQSCQKAAEILEREGVSDEQVARHMDAAGEVLRRRKMFYHDTARIKVANIEGVFVGVTCVFAVTGDPMEVFEMNMELARVEREMDVVKNAAFDVIFKPFISTKPVVNSELA